MHTLFAPNFLSLWIYKGPGATMVAKLSPSAQQPAIDTSVSSLNIPSARQIEQTNDEDLKCRTTCPTNSANMPHSLRSNPSSETRRCSYGQFLHPSDIPKYVHFKTTTPSTSNNALTSSAPHGRSQTNVWTQQRLEQLLHEALATRGDYASACDSDDVDSDNETNAGQHGSVAKHQHVSFPPIKINGEVRTRVGQMQTMLRKIARRMEMGGG